MKDAEGMKERIDKKIIKTKTGIEQRTNIKKEKKRTKHKEK